MPEKALPQFFIGERITRPSGYAGLPHLHRWRCQNKLITVKPAMLAIALHRGRFERSLLAVSLHSGNIYRVEHVGGVERHAYTLQHGADKRKIVLAVKVLHGDSQVLAIFKAPEIGVAVIFGVLVEHVPERGRLAVCYLVCGVHGVMYRVRVKAPALGGVVVILLFSF